MIEQNITDALLEAVRRSGTQGALAEKAKISQSTISDYLRGRCSIGNMTVSVLLRLFPDMKIDFFGGKPESSQSFLLRNQILEIFDSLPEQDQIRFAMMVAANFGDKIREETKK